VTTYTIASGYDASTNSTFPTTNYGSARGSMLVSTAGFPAYLYFPLPPDITGQVITSATLTGYATFTPRPTGRRP
jgi:hypothetical protein